MNEQNYRLLRVGEPLLPTDEWFDQQLKEWNPVNLNRQDPLVTNGAFLCRRKCTLPPEPIAFKDGNHPTKFPILAWATNQVGGPRWNFVFDWETIRRNEFGYTHWIPVPPPVEKLSEAEAAWEEYDNLHPSTVSARDVFVAGHQAGKESK